MNLDHKEIYGQNGPYFQNDTQYKDDSVANGLDNSINDDEQGLYTNQKNDFDDDYKDADDIDPDDLEEEDDLDDDYINEDDELDEDEKILDDEDVDQNRNI